jgi:hypothetical protein
MRTEESANLDPFSILLDPESILQACMSLIKVLPNRRKDIDDPIIKINDGAVRKFLEERSDTKYEGDEQLVDSSIIRHCCIRYLMQPKYGELLQKLPDGTFHTKDPEQNIVTHRFLFYAAKYWHQHFDADPKAPIRAGDQDRVRNFLILPSFATCVQVQSLFVVGHFAQRFDAITDRAESTKRVFPNWLRDDDIFCQYIEFISEWAELLQAGLASKFKGELERCMWGTLGRGNFLSRLPGRYDCSTFAKDDTAKAGARCWIQKLSPHHDGTHVTSCFFNADRYSSLFECFLLPFFSPRSHPMCTVFVQEADCHFLKVGTSAPDRALDARQG